MNSSLCRSASLSASAPLPFAQRLLAAFAFGDFSHPCPYRLDAAAFVADRIKSSQPVSHHPLLARGFSGDLEITHRFSAVEYLVNHRVYRARDERQHVGDRAPEMLGGRDAVDRGERVVDSKIAMLAVKKSYAQGRAGQKRGQFVLRQPAVMDVYAGADKAGNCAGDHAWDTFDQMPAK